ncbi:MAG: hypothetical protein ACE5HJ_08180 [Thermoplasmata archaeon]
MEGQAPQVLFRAPKLMLWKARALPLGILALGFVSAALVIYISWKGYIDAEGSLYLALAPLILLGVGYFGVFVATNPVRITTAGVAPPSKPLSRPTPRRLLIPWREVTAIEETQRLVVGGPPTITYAYVTYDFALHTKDGRRYPFKSRYVAWQTEDTAEIRRAYELMKAIAEALERGRLDRLDQDPTLMERLRDIQTTAYPEYDVFSRTLASKLAMAIGGPMFLAGLALLLLPLADPFLAETLSRILWILGGFFFLMGLSTKRAFAGWGRGRRSSNP